MNHLSLLLLLTALTVACRSKNQTGSETQSPGNTAASALDAGSAGDPTESPDNFVIIPGQQVGAVRAGSTEASLKSLYGPELVVRDTVYLGEGEYEIGTTVFKNTADQIQIIWKDKQAFARPEVMFVRPAYDAQGNLRPGTAGRQVQWRVPVGEGSIGVGTSLREVEQANGKPFKLYGFGWDYGGTTSDWQGGKLMTADKKSFLTLLFGFEPDFSISENKFYDTVLGDGEFLSSLSAMQSLNPTVKSLTVSFP